MLVLLALACSDGDDASSGTATPPSATTTPQPDATAVTTPQTPPEPVELARQHLAGRLGISVGAIEVVSFEQRDWPDSCLGLSLPDMVCAQAITPGYRAVLRAEGREHVYRTDRTMTVLPEEGAGAVTTPTAPGPPGVEAARAGLASRLGVAVSAIEVVSVEPAEWSDSCLGYGRADESCLQAITPGQRVLLRDVAGGLTYEYRTDQQGNFRAPP
jgi:hypothetical protein